MKKWHSAISIMCFFLASVSLLNAEPALAISQTSSVKPITPRSSTPESWTSESLNDKVTIENGTGANLSILITVNNNTQETAPGVVIQNCGDTSHINAGSSAICVTSDAKNPVTFHSDNDNTATGTYQITTQPLSISP